MNWDLVTIFAFVIILTIVRRTYRPVSSSGGNGQLAGGDQAALSGAMDVARRLEQRVEVLERLLDEDAPGWRAKARL